MSPNVCPKFAREASDEIDGALTAPRYARWWLHRLGCARCRAYRHELRATTQFVARAGRLPATTSPPAELLRAFQAQAEAMQASPKRAAALARFLTTANALSQRRWGLLAALVLVTASGLLAFLPQNHVHVGLPLSAGAMCAMAELMGGLMPLVAIAIASRGLRVRLEPAVLATVGGVGALAGQAFAQSRCPANDLTHMLLFHVGVVTAFIFATWGVALWRQPQTRPST
ncbi:MAG: hypothetical protein SF187_01995 [Deltaproteobacteria bacterium]|nr:hypothetical protein [Deltaproteobacteria bacterium]